MAEIPWKTCPNKAFSLLDNSETFSCELNFSFKIYLKSPIFYYTLIVNLFLQLVSGWLWGIIKNYQLQQITASNMIEILTFSIDLCAKLVTESTCWLKLVNLRKRMWIQINNFIFYGF